MNYNAIFTALRCPDTASSIDTPQTKGEWKRFFDMMERLERAQIVTFTKGRYELHPHQHERIAHFAEAVLDSMSLSLALPEQETEVDLSEVIYSREADAVSLYDEIKRLQEKEAALRYGLQSCLAWFRGETDYSRQTMVVFLEQFEDADNTIADALDLAMGTKQCDHCGGFGFTLDTEPAEPVDPYSLPIEEFESLDLEADLENLQMAIVMDFLAEEDALAVSVEAEENAYEDTRHLETIELPVVKLDVMNASITPHSPAGELNATDYQDEAEFWNLEAIALSQYYGRFDDRGELIKHLNSLPTDALVDYIVIGLQLGDEAGGGDVLLYSQPAALWLANDWTKVQVVESASPENKSLEPSPIFTPIVTSTTAEDFAEIARIEAILAASEEDDDRAKRAILIAQYDPETCFVRVNWTRRGFSSGCFELRFIIRQYRQTWYVVRVEEAGKVYNYPVLPELCQLTSTPRKSAAPSLNGLLEGLPIAQAVATYGVEETKEALNEVHKRVVVQALNKEANPQLLPEGV
jgi:hypothetical protein